MTCRKDEVFRKELEGNREKEDSYEKADTRIVAAFSLNTILEMATHLLSVFDIFNFCCIQIHES